MENDQLRRIWDYVNDLSDSIAQGYVSAKDLMTTLKEEAVAIAGKERKMKDSEISVSNDREGVCPVCGSWRISYGGMEEDDWTCESCGASGKEGFVRTFDRHYNVTDKDGKSISGRPE